MCCTEGPADPFLLGGIRCRFVACWYRGVGDGSGQQGAD